MTRGLSGRRRACGRVLALLAGGAAALVAAASASAGTSVEVVVSLEAPPLARAHAESRTLALAARSSRLDLRTPTSRSYVRELAAAQRTLEARIRRSVPEARVRWRYRVVANALALVVPAGRVASLASLPGVLRVYRSVRYHALLDRSPQLIGAPQLWGPDFSTAGNGLKIGVVDDGVDQTHPFFSPAGFSAPAGYPKGQSAFTTAKVIVARAFAPAGPGWKYAGRPFDPQLSEHGTHVAGIAAGNDGTAAQPGVVLSGVAPRAYLGNYKVLTIPTPGFGLDGNSPEIAAGIEAAVKDGMDVINLSLGEPEIQPRRDLVVDAINAAADAGVVPTIAAGNDYEEFGRGSIGSPGSAAKAITAAAVSAGRGGPADVVGSFSSAGPTPVSLQFKPDVSAPGVGILSSVPARDGRWSVFSGTSMAAPHAAGAAALLRQRHPTWTVAQIKSALALTGDPVYPDGERTGEVPATREGGGLLSLPRANDPLVFAAPTSLSLGLLRPGRKAARAVALSDASGGGGEWSVAVAPRGRVRGLTVSAPPSVTVPGTLTVTATAAASAAERELSGFAVLSRAGQSRRIAFWVRVARPRLARAGRSALVRPGTYRGNTGKGRSLVSTYRYPELRSGLGFPTRLAGPEQVFRLVLRRAAANFGAVVVSQARGVSIQPRIVLAGDENRLAGYAALPYNLNPYFSTYGAVVPVVAVDLPERGAYDLVFDTPSRARAGAFRFRFWIGDTTPPSVRLLSHRAVRGKLTLRVADAGSGVDPGSLTAAVRGKRVVAYSPETGRAVIDVRGLRPGRHQLVFSASDYQEAKNMENVARIRPNTRVVRATITR